MPWAQGVVSSNLAAPTKAFICVIISGLHKLDDAGAVEPELSNID